MEDPYDFMLGENLLKSPPNFETAHYHNVNGQFKLKKAQIIHREIVNNSNRCPCCYLPVQTIKYPILVDVNVFSNCGTSYKYFKLLKTYFILLSILLQLEYLLHSIIAGLYNLIQNSKGDQCINDQSCKNNLNNQLSILNRFDPENYQDDVLDVLYAIAFIVQLVFIRYITHQTNDYFNVDHDYDSEKTIQICSLKISSINTQWKRNTILEHFRNGMLESIPFQYNIIDCCLIYDIYHLENELKLQIREVYKKEKSRRLTIKLIDRSLQDILRKTVNQFYTMSNSKKYLKFTGSVYITLSDQQEAINFKKQFKRNFCLEQCPRPSDVIWKKIRSNGNPKLQLIKTAIALCGWLPNIAIEVAKNDYILSNPGKSQDQYQINTLLSLVTALILFLSSKICIHTIHNYVKQSFQDSKRQYWKQYLQMNEVIICIMFYLGPPIFVAVYSGEGTRQEKLWRSGGLSEDIIMIILVNAGLQILFTIMDIGQAWKLIKIIYYKYFNKGSNLTQFEANKLFSKKLNFNKKRVDLTILVFQCSYYGYLFPICYPITLISLLIIYWLNKYQFINNGTNQKIQFKYRLSKIMTFMVIASQLGSTQIIKITYLGYTSNQAFNYIYYAKCIILIYLFWIKPELLFKKRTQTNKTNLDLVSSLQNNDLYPKYNPVVNENHLNSLSQQQSSLDMVVQLRLSRQQKYYEALQIKLLREIEELEKSELSTVQKNHIRPIQEDVN
ncbi:unnamed protein product (macronuclear) [Paramecium tetraurelia]|uniref:CSC1/OSCA1-like cytosolic domain-containing protein n=1 Tax=Paramecium tetraurelia TaxID=5888 RepID=A0D9S4_PARTE|nr:uncharacterized protein GSPATT00014722001 [Paramecium tetraurelia]CAK79791.1 unnamed protein product [Paramecium tetraurelia]|eukprot:XP_001447188.1 hypothetical protein (macronuclear) [Paramecium tetraurelia strain d4-2]